MRILACTATLIVVDKPAGLPAVPGRAPGLQDCVASRVQASHPEARVVHRLDMATSGLMLMARGAAAQRALSAAFERRAVDKRYVALVAGTLVPAAPGGDWAQIDLPLAADWPARPRQKVDRTHGKPAFTRWRVLGHEHVGDIACTRVELQPLTGRTHQLRVHLAAIGHPILGDALYDAAPAAPRCERLMLHACALAFADPLGGAALAFDSAVPF